MEELAANDLPILDDPGQLLLFVSGTAGTGKSFVIHTIADALTLKYPAPGGNVTRNPPVVICAPTGIAAVQIKGLFDSSTLWNELSQHQVPRSTHSSRLEWIANDARS